MKVETYNDTTYRVILEFTPETIKQIREGISMVYKCPFDDDIIIKTYREE
jgi:hypothetical protein